jgi:hypothetical protein
LRVAGVADEAPEFKSEKTVNIDVSGTDEWRYQLLETDDKYYVKRSDREQVFTLSQYEYNRLAGVNGTELKVVKEQGSTLNDVQPDVSNVVDGG